VNNLLMDAAEILADGELGPVWTQFRFNGIDNYGRTTYCVLGAIRLAWHNRQYEDALSYGQTIRELSDYLVDNGYANRYLPETTITNWNDRPERSAEEVISVLMRAGSRDTASHSTIEPD